MNNFKSAFSPKLESMLKFRVARGFKNQIHLANLHRFDSFCLEYYPLETELTAKIVYDWIDIQTVQSPNTLNERASTIRQLGLYLSAIGDNAFVLTEKFCTNRNNNIPYIFTDAEMAALFSAIDKVSADKLEPNLNEIMPVLFRLTYTCGLRPNEVRELMCENIDLKNGIITIINTKKNKDRIVVMSDDMLEMCRRYEKKRTIFANGNPYFFPSNKGSTFKSQRLQSILTKAWIKAICSKECPLPPRIRVYDLRHQMASTCLNNWLEEGKDLMSMLPYLQSYMGHASMNETAYYIHILPENLMRSSGVNWSKFNAMFPEVTL